MGYAQVLTTASKASATGGTFADALTANSGDSLDVAAFAPGTGARMLECWGIDGDSVAEFEFIYTRPQATHDQQHGFRVQCPSIALGGAATNAAFNFLPGAQRIDVFQSDTLTINVSATASDSLVSSFIIEYDNLPGADGVFATPQQVQALRKADVGIYVNATASSTVGAYGASRAINADDDRFHANTWYAILGASVQTQVTSISLIGPDWGGQRVGMPAGSLDLNSNGWFQDQSYKWNKAMIPCFQSANKGSVLVYVADAEASTAPKIDFNLVELTGPPA